MGVPIRAEKHELVDAKHKQIVLAHAQSAPESSYQNAAKNVEGGVVMKREQCRYSHWSFILVF